MIISVSPHIKSRETIASVMRDVLIALAPAGVAAVYLFGTNVLWILCASVSFCVISEYVFQKVTKKRVGVYDLSAVVTGVLLAFSLPPGVPVWMVCVGAVFAIVVGKEIFGGIGYNPFNPALVGRAFLHISWPTEMSSWVLPYSNLTSASPLSVVKFGLNGDIPAYLELFFGNVAGCIGETSKIALLAGVVYLVMRKQIKLLAPFSYIITVVVVSLVAGRDAVFHLLSGGLILGVFFMATDPVTTPVPAKGKIIFGAGCGILTMLIRLWGGFPEGVCYSILIMNILVPFIDRATIPRRFGA
ncbi:MAG: RnfABCDGE type electron transport complex subunit D [Elusimicrobia bacterium]|nr:RnfABCDGE type electron transport complex subunit D [Elusimicrobiota bacterium]